MYAMKRLCQLSLVALLFLLVAFVGCSSASSDQRAFTDSEIIQIMLTLHEGEIRHGELAGVRSPSRSVQEYAGIIAGDHRAGGSELRTLASSSAELTPAETELSAQLASNSNRSLETLGTWRGAEFDRKFIDAQIELYEWMLRTIEENLVPAARNEELRALLEGQRVSSAGHLARARQVKAGLSAVRRDADRCRGAEKARRVICCCRSKNFSHSSTFSARKSRPRPVIRGTSCDQAYPPDVRSRRIAPLHFRLSAADSL